MDDSDILELIQSEVHKAQQAGKFNLTTPPNHRHTGRGQDAPRINQADIIPGQRAEGSITMEQETVYKIGVIFNPSAIWVHGNVTGPNGEKFLIVGNAQIGSSFYLQPSNSVSVITGGPQQNIIQSTSYFGVDSGGSFHTLVDEGHIVDIFYGGVLHVRATVGNVNQTKIYDSNNIYVFVNTLVSGWTINLSWTVT